MRACTTPIRPTKTVMYTDTDSDIAARSCGLAWPVMAVSSTPKEMPAHWLISTGHAWRAMSRMVAPNPGEGAAAGVIGWA
ncbi:Uncharacterised protein [Bordetella pertussis]|nr:Uncharacterised protein [Bordetella pertussis]CFL85183.1 Uncharacterised protein [Bordetella pertussis]CFO03001.1 Uncharacterised protein [Bordetella pertussis]CFO27532.1 Uncharacterised protein [Bordetella pertussis]CFO98021.1 Uncharacterised protein [Bordetella pertussis]